MRTRIQSRFVLFLLLGPTGCQTAHEADRIEDNPGALLVGTWQVHSLNEVERPAAEPTFITFASDGSYTVACESGANRGTKKGKYSLDGNVLHFQSTEEWEGYKLWRHVVTSVDDNELRMSNHPDDVQRRYVFRRVRNV